MNILKLLFLVTLTTSVKLYSQVEGSGVSSPQISGNPCNLSVSSVVYYYPNPICDDIFYCYDDSGNRVYRFTYICKNNGSGSGASSPLPRAIMQVNDVKEEDIISVIETVLLYPNPTSGPINIVFDKQILNAKLILIDNTGKILNEINVDSKIAQLDLSPYSNGIYYISIIKKDTKFTKQVIKY